MKDFFSGMLSFLLLMVLVLVGVAFLTLLERKVLGYIQIRKGPNKVGMIGILQAFSDAIKLFTKENTYPSKSNYLVYYFCPIFSFLLCFICWSLIPFLWCMINFNFGFLFFMVCLSMGVYGVMVAGWSSNSSYSLLGGLRAVAQTISYEVSLAFLMMNMLILSGSYSLLDFYWLQNFCWFLFTSFPLFLLLFTSMLAETNRTPFDFAEGESELVSGFNVEYSSGGFALIFLAEYASILLMSLVVVLMFFGGETSSALFFIMVSFLAFSFIWVRGTLPRYRYDKLMNVCWKSFLPVSLLYLVFYFSLKLFIMMSMF
uniref:NADH-ubiquinone oxidoreductase chain 1 n=1 Tax=Amphigerontia montivaga TaxID=2051644 RepID=A0A343QCE7_9NEOP|nr:NADH dehydrogenase subunit 1 [Amphigerontia montivaga]ATU07094.1 NADH dehydrogenase subunit 1 [Amphigerontia montivaga]